MKPKDRIAQMILERISVPRLRQVDVSMLHPTVRALVAAGHANFSLWKTPHEEQAVSAPLEALDRDQRNRRRKSSRSRTGMSKWPKGLKRQQREMRNKGMKDGARAEK